jgi:WD40 repeat protein
VGILDELGCTTVWSVPTLEVRELARPNLITRLSDLAFIDDERLLIAQINTSLNITTLQAGTSQTAIITDVTSAITVIALSNDGRYLAVGYNDGTVNIFTTVDQAVIQRFQLPDGLPTALEFSPTNTLLASGDNAGYVTLWELP